MDHQPTPQAFTSHFLSAQRFIYHSSVVCCLCRFHNSLKRKKRGGGGGAGGGGAEERDRVWTEELGLLGGGQQGVKGRD